MLVSGQGHAHGSHGLPGLAGRVGSGDQVGGPPQFYTIIGRPDAVVEIWGQWEPLLWLYQLSGLKQATKHLLDAMGEHGSFASCTDLAIPP